MESYQVVGIIMGLIGIFISIGMFFAPLIDYTLGWVTVLSPITLILSIIAIIVSLASPRYKRGVGVYYLVAGIISNWLLIIPAIMAFRYKPEIRDSGINTRL